MDRAQKLFFAAACVLALIAVSAVERLAVPLAFFVFLLILFIGLRYVEIQFPFSYVLRRLHLLQEEENVRIEKEIREIRLRVLRRTSEKPKASNDGNQEKEFFRRGSTTRYPSNPAVGYRGALVKIPASTIACRECGGRGRIEVKVRTEKWKELEVRSFPCNKCRGNGFLPSAL